MSDASTPPLVDHSFAVLGENAAANHARALILDLGGRLTNDAHHVVDLATAPDPSTDWATSGAMWLTGRAAGAPLMAPGSPASAVRAALAVFECLRTIHGTSGIGLPGPGLLAERAAFSGFRRRGPWSCGGAFRALRAKDGWLGISLPRADDVDMVPALTEDPRAKTEHPWDVVAGWVAHADASAAADRAQLLGIAAAPIPVCRGSAHRIRARRPGVNRRGVSYQAGGVRRSRRARPLVVDLTSLWAGPLCAHLLSAAGAEVIKVESRRRPDGGRRGPTGFYALLHGGHRSVALDFDSPGTPDILRELMTSADVVLEASRPRAMRQLGIYAEDIVDSGTIWTSITAYGRTGAHADRVGFGDDVAAAAGLVIPDGEDLLPCGDAIADPMTGVVAAVATLAALVGRRAVLNDVSMFDVVSSAVDDCAIDSAGGAVLRDGDRWYAETPSGRVAVKTPEVRAVGRQAAACGADTESVLARFGLS